MNESIDQSKPSERALGQPTARLLRQLAAAAPLPPSPTPPTATLLGLRILRELRVPCKSTGAFG